MPDLLRILAAAIVLAIIMLPQASVEASDFSYNANREYQGRQHRIRCEEHPDKYCLTEPEREIDKAEREYRKRQFRIRTWCRGGGDEFWPECIAVGAGR